ncbi:VIT1/CCC1 transporter family protein [Lapillicoccus jejuensis]|uniref:VIT1/CCC1 family predicted Fe2+/Mn2+ transporter n=1 Tax=Lapillicoccus jejuensis TaxID=402171 RepID=A0A542DWC6_9MICO|nr:VIT family protein [Lapillicoccus jejuensis]TQJ07392.1 VIT1/CCC1 family predicted Fe2+/Mn2+ transporter [Lapillicoccus jejuensis]
MTETLPTHAAEPHAEAASGRLNWLRAAVLGANDGIVSTAGVIIGVAGATTERGPITTAGVAALVAGALSMAVGEYVSVSTQRDTEQALIAKETRELREFPEEELEELTQMYEAKGLERGLAEQVAQQLTEHDALGAHAEIELNIDPDELTNPWHAAFASMAAFTVGGLVPFLAALLASASLRVPLLLVFVVVALALTGATSARLGGMPPGRQVARNVVGGLLAMVVTYGIGHLVGRAL